MSDADVLLTIAELAVVFAGFASLVGILGERDAVDDVRVLSARMRAMLTSSLMVVGFALLPLVLARLDIRPDAIWAAAPWALLIAVAGYVLWLIGTLRRLRRARIPQRWVQQLVILPVLLLTIVMLTLLTFINVWIRSPGLYLTALYLLLLHAGFAFALIVYSFLPNLD